MSRYLQILLLTFFCGHCLFAKEAANDFWTLMKKDKSPNHQHVLPTPGWKLYESLFKKYQHHKIVFHGRRKPKIPHKIHLIWLGTPMPDFSRKMVESWKKIHPDWKVKLWTDADLPSFHLKNRRAYEKSNNWGEKSDIFRYEILLRHGGLYVDAADFECLRRFDKLHDLCDFYVGIAYGGGSIVYNGLIGCRPNHPIMKRCVDSIRCGNGDHSRWRIVNATGPYFLTKCMKDSLANRKAKKKQGIVVAFPTIFFYPFPDGLQKEYSNTDIVKKEFVYPESYAIHYWTSSWASL